MASLAELFSSTFDVEIPSPLSSAVDIVTFAESKEFLNIKLYPIQRFILKLLFNLGLSPDLDEPILLPDMFNTKIEHSFYSEIDFKQWLYDHEYLNSMIHEYPIIESNLAIGRRGTKSSMSTIIAAYSLYLVLLNYNPQKYFGILESSEISVLLCSNSRGNAARLYRDLSKLIYGAAFFQPYLIVKKISQISGEEFKLGTKRYMEEGQGGLIIISVFAVNPSVRGGNNVIVIADEYAHYIDAEKSTKEKPLDKVLYEAAVPSLSGFRNPDGTAFGKAIFISSPNGQKGRFYEEKVRSRDNPEVFFLNLPSWWMNPNIPEQFLRKMFNESEVSFNQEFRAEFILSGLSTWVRRQEFFFNSTCDRLICDVDDVINIKEGKAFTKHYGSADLALTGDGAVVSICHYESEYDRVNKINNDELITNKGIFVYDYIYYTYPERGVPTRIKEVVDVMIKCMYKFRLEEFLIDNWSYEMFLQYLEDMSLANPANKDYMKLRRIIKISNTTQASNNDYARTFRTNLVAGCLAYPNENEVLTQLTGLKENIVGRSVKVENKSGRDDIPNSMFKCLHACVNDRNRDKVNVIVPRVKKYDSNQRLRSMQRGKITARR